MTWTVDFYEEQDGSAPVEEFLETLPGKHKAKGGNHDSVESLLSKAT